MPSLHGVHTVLAGYPTPRSRQLVQSRECSWSSLGVIHSQPRRDKRQGMKSIPQGPRRIKSRCSGLWGASSLQDTKRQGAGDSTRDWVGWALGRDGNNSFLNPDTWNIQVLSWSFMSLYTLHMTIVIRVKSIINAFFCIELLLTFLHACVGKFKRCLQHFL